ncbi:phosphate-repressible phosphate permease [Podospora aff. communis PSN243]|uniref:Phosphate transporter n=1 Tax=Podospora aff. communis PSN243 TaxID=3040156 RepID=A0AAV9GG24_9PEZI|nr:phosphate-repressible phosphate permease [Podospora aff. communis PSN243]
MPLHQWDYLFAIGTIFAGLDAWNIGANDVANSWATSVGSQSVTYMQAMILGSIMEFGGALGVGARVADTIRTKVVDTSLFKADPGVLMLGMVCAVTASSIYLTIATRFGLPVSTTHSIMGGVIGMGVAAVGADGVQWVGKGTGLGAVNSGVVQVFLAWIIAPGLSGIFGAIIFTITKYGVMLRKNPVWKAFFLVPLYFGVTACLLTMLLLWKGGNYTITLTDPEVAGTIVGVGAAWALVIAFFLNPWLYRVVIKEDWQLRWWHIFMGPLLLRRADPPPAPEGQLLKDYYAGHLTKEELDARRAAQRGDVEVVGAEATAENGEKKIGSDVSEPDVPPPPKAPVKKLVGPKPEGAWYTGAVLFWYIKWALLRGVDQDVVNMQNKKSVMSSDVEELHAHAPHYDNRAEHMYSFLQVMTAATASFTHGANDISNAIGPYATVYQIWNDGALPAKDKSEVPIWILVYGGALLVIGLWTYGYNIMKNLGNRITLHSPSRGFSMELGSAVTVIMATRLKLPISTTQCITGATVGVGLCSGTWRTINWRMVTWIYLGWFITLPMTGIISGCLMGIIINAPRWGLGNA